MAHRLPIRPHGLFLAVFVVELLLPLFAVGERVGDCVTLGNIVEHFNGTSKALSNWKGDDCCTWEGVNCSFQSSPTVEKLLLNSSNLNGTIPPLLFNLTSLNHLDLSHNYFSGSIPKQLWLLKNLIQLDLSWNNLDAEIPPPFQINSCNNLEVFSLEHNNIQGYIPGEIGQCSKLQKFLVGNNQLSGQVPGGLFAISSLTHVSVAGNRLEGSLPTFENLNLLVSLDMSNNCINGSVLLGDQLPNIKFLDLSDNQISTYNMISVNFENFIMLNISGNRVVQWDFLDNMTECWSFKELDLSNNDYRGPFPKFTVAVSDRLVSLRLRGNTISEGLDFGILKLINLSLFDMGNTTLSGTIPSSISNLTSLRKLILDHNNLDGGLSECLASLHNLQVLDISYNSFTGHIPTNTSRSLVSLNLSHNGFDGTLPQEVDQMRNLTTFDVSYNDLSGEIPSLANCKQLELIMLQHNNLSGHIPEFFGKMDKLKLLDLSYNDLEGKLPTGDIFNDPSRFRIEGNGKLCRDNPDNLASVLEFCHEHPTGKSISGLPKAALAIIIIVVLVFLLLLLFWLFYKSKRFVYIDFGAFVKGISFQNAPLNVTSSDLQTATKGFSSAYLIGSGGIGSVYRGFLEREKKEVAVKVLKEETFGDSKSFLEECYSIRMIAHRNLLKMLTSCLNVDIEGNQFKALIYEFMPNGNLGMWLHEEVVSQAMSFKKWNLNLYQRLSLAIDVASLLSLLHCDFETPIVHCNLKPSNILISEDMTAHVADFGMNKFYKVDAIVRNSAGYIAPEYSTGSPISPMWDVYSFGVILLEMFTGKRPTHEDLGGTLSLHKYVHQGCPSNIEEIIDPLLVSEETGGKLTDRARECILSILNVALTCSEELPEDRMEIKAALEKLQQAKLSFLYAGGNGAMPHDNFSREEASNAMLV